MKKKTKRKTKIKVILICFFSITLLFLSVGYSILKQDIKILGKVSIQSQEPERQDYIVTYVIDSKWYSNGKYYYKITMTLFNNTNTTLDGWMIAIQAPANAEIVNYASVQCELKEKTIEFTNVSYNAQVPSKTSISFEFQVATTDAYYQPSNIVVNGSNQVPPEEPEKPGEVEKKAIIELVEENTWESSVQFYFHQYTVTVQNVGTSEIHGWQFDLDFKKEATIEQIWNGEIEKKTQQMYTLKNSAYSGIIPVQGKTNFGFIVKTTMKKLSLEPTNIVLK